MMYFLYFVIAFVVTVAITPLVKKLAWKIGTVDVPRPPRWLHKNPVPKMGGLAIFLSTLIAVVLYINFGEINYHVVPLKFITAMVSAGAVLIVGGILDDKYDLPASLQWIAPALAGLIVVLSGIGVGITHISNPFGDPISLKFAVIGIPAAAIFSWIWLMGMTFTTKFLDGMDGLVSGITLIASVTLFFLSIGPQVNQPITATLAIILAGALAGFLVYNFSPASIFLGEGGSTFIGFTLGVLSIILGGKITTAFLVMGIPILDVAWVLVRRLWYGRSPFVGDRSHLHMRLNDIGFSQRATALILYLISAVFGFTAVFLQSMGKLIALFVLFGVMICLAVGVVMMYKRRAPHIPEEPLER